VVRQLVPLEKINAHTAHIVSQEAQRPQVQPIEQYAIFRKSGQHSSCRFIVSELQIPLMTEQCIPRCRLQGAPIQRLSRLQQEFENTLHNYENLLIVKTTLLRHWCCAVGRMVRCSQPNQQEGLLGWLCRPQALPRLQCLPIKLALSHPPAPAPHRLELPRRQSVELRLKNATWCTSQISLRHRRPEPLAVCFVTSTVHSEKYPCRATRGVAHC
jgi:hypothetical protein